MSKYGDKTRIIDRPSCGNTELQLHRGVHYTSGKGEEFGFCQNCKNVVISGYFTKSGMTFINIMNYMLIHNLLQNEGIIK